MQRPQSAPAQSFNQNFNQNFNANQAAYAPQQQSQQTPYSPGTTRKLISAREVCNPFQSDEQRRLIDDANQIDQFILNENRMAEQRVQTARANPNAVNNQVHPENPNKMQPAFQQPSFDYLQRTTQNYAIEADCVQINGKWIPIEQPNLSHRRPAFNDQHFEAFDYPHFEVVEKPDERRAYCIPEEPTSFEPFESTLIDSSYRLPLSDDLYQTFEDT